MALEIWKRPYFIAVSGLHFITWDLHLMPHPPTMSTMCQGAPYWVPSEPGEIRSSVIMWPIFGTIFPSKGIPDHAFAVLHSQHPSRYLIYWSTNPWYPAVTKIPWIDVHPGINKKWKKSMAFEETHIQYPFPTVTNQTFFSPVPHQFQPFEPLRLAAGSFSGGE